MIKLIFNTILGLCLIFIWSRFVNPEEIFFSISKVNPTYLIPVFFFMLLSPILRSIRLQIFLSEIKKIKLMDLIFLNGVAVMLNFFIPIRAGEVAKGVYLHTNYGLPMGKAVIWVFLDRFLDFLTVLLLATFLVLIVPTNLPQNFITTSIITFGAALFITYLAIYQANISKKLARFLSHLLIEKHIKRYFDKFSNFILDSFTILRRHPKDLFLMIIVTVLSYAADGAVWYFIFIALGFNFDFLKMFLGQLLSALTYLIPAAPGYVGSAEASGLLILSGVFGIDNNLASAMIVLFHILIAIFVLVFGIISIYNLKINLGYILRKALKKE